MPSTEEANAPKTIDITGDSFSSRHMCALAAKRFPDSKIRLWTKPLSDKKLTLVPPMFRSHQGLNYRIESSNSPQVFLSGRKRSLLEPHVQPLSQAVTHLIKQLVYSNYFPASLFTLKGIPKINYQWEKESLSRPLINTQNLLWASIKSIDRIWMQKLTQTNKNLSVLSNQKINQVMQEQSELKLSLSAPHEPLYSNHLIDCSGSKKLDKHFKWKWNSYSSTVDTHLTSSLPNFFIIVAKDAGEEFLDSGLLSDGAIYRGLCIEEPDDKSKTYIQIDRLSDSSLDAVENCTAFKSTHLSFLDQLDWTHIESTVDDYVFEQSTLHELSIRNIDPLSTAKTQHVSTVCNTHSVSLKT